MKSQHTTEEALEATARCLLGGMPKMVAKHYLIKDGFDHKKASTIVRWALLLIKRTYHGQHT